MKKVADFHLLRLGLVTVTVFATLGFLQPDTFLTADNFSSMAAQLSEFGLIALALFLPMLTGGIDLAVVSIANLAAISAAMWAQAHPDLYGLGVPLALLVGLVCGLFNGWLIAFCRFPAILATLGTMQMFAGISLVLTHGSSVSGLPEAVTELAVATPLGMPVSAWVFLAAAIVLWALSHYTIYGFQARLYGANPRAALFAGVRERRVIMLTYAVSGVLAALAGLIVLMRVNSANADYGASYLLLAILINVLGGVDPRGGAGRLQGVVLAVLLLQGLSSGLNVMQISNFAKELTYGVLLVVMMIANRWRLADLKRWFNRKVNANE